MLNLSDADLAQLRLECYGHCMDIAVVGARDEPHKIDTAQVMLATEKLLAWCLRDRDEP